MEKKLVRVKLLSNGGFNLFNGNNNRTWPVIVNAEVVDNLLVRVPNRELLALGGDAFNLLGFDSLSWMLVSRVVDVDANGNDVIEPIEAVIL